MGALALTDRDGVRGAVKFAKSCLVHGLAPILGADFAVTPDEDSTAPGHRPARRLPARGGAVVDPRHPRVTVLARGGPLTPVRPGGGVPTGAGWAALNRLVSATHLGTGEAPGERGRPVSSRELVARHAAAGGLVVLLGPDSEVGRALAVRRPDLARVALDRWREVVAPALLRIEVVSHRGPGSGLGSSVLAARLLSFARDQGRGGDPHQHRALRRAGRGGHVRPPRLRPTARGPRPASRRPGQRRGLPEARCGDGPGRGRGGPAGRRGGRHREDLRPPAAGRDGCAGCRLRARPGPRPRSRGGPPARARGGRCQRTTGARGAARAVRGRARCPLPRGRPAAACRAGPARRRARGDRRPRLRDLLPHRGRGLRDHPLARRTGRRPRVRSRQPGAARARGVRRRAPAPRPAHGALPHPPASSPPRRRHRRRVRSAGRGLRGGPRPFRG